MPKYEVTLWEKVTHTFTVEADSEEDAAEQAGEMVDGDNTGVSQGCYATTINKVEERDSYQTELVDRTAPRWVWELIDETLHNDSKSSAFDPALRASLTEAIEAMGEACERGE